MEVAECRGCRKEFIGKPYYMGEKAYHKGSMEPVAKHFLGGFVCSDICDKKIMDEFNSTIP